MTSSLMKWWKWCPTGAQSTLNPGYTASKSHQTGHVSTAAMVHLGDSMPGAQDLTFQSRFWYSWTTLSNVIKSHWSHSTMTKVFQHEILCWNGRREGCNDIPFWMFGIWIVWNMDHRSKVATNKTDRPTDTFSFSNDSVRCQPGLLPCNTIHNSFPETYTTRWYNTIDSASIMARNTRMAMRGLKLQTQSGNQWSLCRKEIASTTIKAVTWYLQVLAKCTSLKVNYHNLFSLPTSLSFASCVCSWISTVPPVTKFEEQPSRVRHLVCVIKKNKIHHHHNF